MVGDVAGPIMSIGFNIATLGLRIVKTFIDSVYNADGELVFENFSLLDNSVSCPKLLFTAAYHAAHTEGSAVFASVCLLGSCLIVITIMLHLNRNYKTWARIRIVGMAILLALGFCLYHYHMKIPMDHAWHTVVVPSIICSLVWLEVVLLIRTQIKQDGGNEHLLRDLLMKLVETAISIYRCADLIQTPDSPWDAQKILLLLGSSPPMIIVACQIGWIVYKANIISKVVEWFMKIPRVLARKTEQAAGATMRGNGGRDAGDQVADERVETGNGLPVTIGDSKVSRIAYIAGIMFNIKWFRKNHGVSAVEDEQAAGASMEKYGGGDSGQQVHEEELKVVVASPA